MKTLLIALALVPLAGCAGLLGSATVPKSDVTVAYTLAPNQGQASFSATSAACGVVASGVVDVNKGAAACVAANAGTALVGQLNAPAK